MSHPGPLLTDYVDGTLGAAERAEVDGHLATCATCRSEVMLATAGRDAARSASDVTVPHGIADAAIAEAARRPAPATPHGARRSRSGTPRWAVVAGVAAAIALLALAIPKLGNAPGVTAGSSSAAAGAAVTFPQATAVEVARPTVNVTQADLSAVASGFRAADAAEGAQGGSASAVPAASAPLADATVASADPGRLEEASVCLNRAYKRTPGTLTRVVQARYEGAPAYFGLYAVGPGAGLPPTRIQLVVASIDGCDLLGTSYVLL